MINFILSNRFERSFMKKMKSYLKSLILVLISFFSILPVLIRRTDRIGLWSGDYYDVNSSGDPRLGLTYQELKDKNIKYIEFIRVGTSTLKNTLSNFYKRKRPVIYYDALFEFLNLLPSRLKMQSIKSKTGFTDNFWEQFESLHFVSLKVLIIRLLNYTLKIKKFVVWEFSHRQAAIIFACKLDNIKTIGFQHGIGMPNYMAHEWISLFKDHYPIGPDVMGVWSEFWKKSFMDKSNIYVKLTICAFPRELSTIRKKIYPHKKKLNVLYLSEPLMEPEVIGQHLEAISNNFNLTFKARYKNDLFIKKLKNLPNLDYHISFKPIPEIFDEFDLVIATHTTALLEAAISGKPILFIQTSKWMDYFNLNLISSRLYDFEIVTPDDVVSRLYFAYSIYQKSDPQTILEFRNKVREIFFGLSDTKFNSWLISEIRE
jgi:hypothetical protein